MALCNTKTLYLVVNGVGISIRATPNRIFKLEESLYSLKVFKDGVKFVPSVEEFALIQKELEQILRMS